MTKKCKGCNKEFETPNKQRFYCTQKCKSDHNNALVKKKVVKKEKPGFFDWKDYKELIL